MGKTILTFRDLDAWEAGMDTVVAVYRLTALLPSDERFVLSAQMRRAAISIPANVAEGHCRRNPKVNLNHVKIALGSQAELETEVEIAKRLGFIDANTCDQMAKLGSRLRPLLHGLRRSIARRYGLNEAD
jgi:four helix bundle protein